MNRDALWWVTTCLAIALTAAIAPVEEGAAGPARFRVVALRLVLFGGPILAGIATARSSKRQIESWLLIGVVAVSSFFVYLFAWVNFIIAVFILATLMGIDLSQL
jgi:hypothetical protein